MLQGHTWRMIGGTDWCTGLHGGLTLVDVVEGGVARGDEVHEDAKGVDVVLVRAGELLKALGGGVLQGVCLGGGGGGGGCGGARVLRQPEVADLGLCVLSSATGQVGAVLVSCIWRAACGAHHC
jgi:hypothetical protein